MTDATEVDVLSKLASHANDDGQSCFAGVPRIAKLVRRSKRTVQRAIDKLELAGWITVKRGDGAGNLTQYEINVEMLKGCQDVTLLPKSKRVTLAQKRVTPATQKGDIGDKPYKEGNVFKQKASTRPPNPLVTEGAKREQDLERAVDRAVDQVCSALDIPENQRRRRRMIAGAVKRACEKGDPPPTVALAMIAAVREQDALFLRGDLKFKNGLDKFIGVGIWRDRDRWGWDAQEMRRHGAASVGVYESRN